MKIIIFILLTGIFILSGCILEQTEAGCSGINDAEKKGDCYYLLALKIAQTDPDKAEAYCNFRTSNPKITHCKEDVAGEVANVDADRALKICNSFDNNDQYQRDDYKYCLNNVLRVLNNNNSKKLAEICGGKEYLVCINEFDSKFKTGNMSN